MFVHYTTSAWCAHRDLNAGTKVKSLVLYLTKLWAQFNKKYRIAHFLSVSDTLYYLGGDEVNRTLVLSFIRAVRYHFATSP